MAADPKEPVSAPASARPAEPTKKAGKSYNPLKWFGALNLRMQMLGIFLVIIVAMILSEGSGKKKQAPTPAATPPPPINTQNLNPAVGPGAIPSTNLNVPIEERFPEVTPSAATMEALGKNKSKSVENPNVSLDRGVPEAIMGDVTPNEGADALAGAAQQAGSTASAAGMPYAPGKGKRAIAPEVMGMFGSPPPVEAPHATLAQSVSSQVPASGQAAAPDLNVYAPFGRLVRCKLVNTIDSLVPENCPIIAIVVEDVNFNGHVIIPATTEVYAYVNGKPKLDASGVGRLFDTGEWTLVLPRQPGGKNGREWNVKGRAMDRRETLLNDDGTARAWAIDDMAPGLIGYTISTLDNEVIKQFVASFISSAATAAATVGQTQQAAPGLPGALGATVPAPSASNAALAAVGAGTAASFNSIADRITNELKDRGFYVRVPAGKEFYLFVEQTLDPAQAKVGLHRATATIPSSNDQKL
jgi:hypothetical protein